MILSSDNASGYDTDYLDLIFARTSDDSNQSSDSDSDDGYYNESDYDSDDSDSDEN